MPEKQVINPSDLFNSNNYGFSQIIMTPPGRLVFISGQVAWDENENITGKGDLEVQTRKSIENLERAMTAVGGSLQDIVMLRIYRVNYVKEDGPVIGKVLLEKFGSTSPPASTWVSVNGLANEDFMIEIEAQAVII